MKTWQDVIDAEDDKAIRQEVQRLKGWHFAASRQDGPAHITEGGTGAMSLCGYGIERRYYFQATNMCQRCRKIMLAKMGIPS